ncbi:hypothetical protein AGMMS49938_17680 [Fibrobacterales bacterium]|nr:hypothetical protein AGMMS49938_17680 [Fibrobacterales bacterium]
MRRQYKRWLSQKNNTELSVIFYSDNLDEVNGIANSLRSACAYMLAQGKNVRLWGSAFHTRTNGVIEDHFIVLFPRRASMEQLGYADSELAFPHLAPILKILRRRPPNILELETPSPGAWMIGFAAKIIGIKVLSNYRTDVPSYTNSLVKQAWMRRYVLLLMQVFYRIFRPVISPCRAYKKILETDIKVPPAQIKILPRGIPLENFSPLLRAGGESPRNAPPSKEPLLKDPPCVASLHSEATPPPVQDARRADKGIYDPPSLQPHIAGDQWSPLHATPTIKFLYVGRISVEKSIPFLETLWKQFSKNNSNVELLFVGGGWYLETLKENMKNCPSAKFAGIKTGKELATIYANADFFLFPSGTDTFGNVVVESLASGTPVLVSDKGGPQDIIQNCGKILPFENLEEWLAGLKNCVEIYPTPAYQSLRLAAVERSKDFTLEKMTSAQWDFFKSIKRTSINLISG